MRAQISVSALKDCGENRKEPYKLRVLHHAHAQFSA